jgi:2-amino-4-hydroxy-6-hydroxymethyldihydropteridine diphosphokinase
MNSERVFIGLGANLGKAQVTVRQAISELSSLPKTRLVRASSLYVSEPIDAHGDDFINAVVEISTSLIPEELLTALTTIERHFGRTRSHRNAPRSLDLDLLLYGQLTVNTTTLQIPHPRMTERAFVLIPLIEIAPDVTIPSKGLAHRFLSDVVHQTIHKMD